MARDQVERMDAAAAELESSASRAGAEFEELLDKLRGPGRPAGRRARARRAGSAGAGGDLERPGGGRRRPACARSAARRWRPSRRPAKSAEAEDALRCRGASSGDSVEFSFEGLPGAGDRIRAERVGRVEFADTGLADADDPTDPPEFELEEA